jgi:hypothetical protein
MRKIGTRLFCGWMIGYFDVWFWNAIPLRSAPRKAEWVKEWHS